MSSIHWRKVGWDLTGLRPRLRPPISRAWRVWDTASSDISYVLGVRTLFDRRKIPSAHPRYPPELCHRRFKGQPTFARGGKGEMFRDPTVAELKTISGWAPRKDLLSKGVQHRPCQEVMSHSTTIYILILAFFQKEPCSSILSELSSISSSNCHPSPLRLLAWGRRAIMLIRG